MKPMVELNMPRPMVLFGKKNNVGNRLFFVKQVLESERENQKFALYDDMPEADNLAIYAGMYGIASSQLVNEIIEIWGPKANRRRLAGTLSTG